MHIECMAKENTLKNAFYAYFCRLRDSCACSIVDWIFKIIWRPSLGGHKLYIYGQFLVVVFQIIDTSIFLPWTEPDPTYIFFSKSGVGTFVGQAYDQVYSIQCTWRQKEQVLKEGEGEAADVPLLKPNTQILGQNESYITEYGSYYYDVQQGTVIKHRLNR